MQQNPGALVEGRLAIRNYETSDGEKRKAVEVVANDVQFLDLEATINGRLVGIEMADVPGKSKHDALVNRIRVALGERLRNDPAFRTAFGQYHLSVKLSGFGAHRARELEGNREADALVEELSRFILGFGGIPCGPGKTPC